MTASLFWILRIGALYLLSGFVFALYFITRGVERLDEGARGAKTLTRLLWLPAAGLLWPVWLFTLLRSNRIK